MQRNLQIGLDGALHIREERLSSSPDACRLLYVSDIHLRARRSERLSQQVVEAVAIGRPDAILLGGDLVDQASELSSLTMLVRKLAELAPVQAIGGNHDFAVGIRAVCEAVIVGGGQWIHETTVSIGHLGRIIAIAGPDAPIPTTGDVRVLCGHNPRIWKTSRHQNWDLVLAGHLHGCQCVAFEFRHLQWPGALFYPYCYRNHQSGSTRLVVSQGVSDLIPVRWRCPREVVLCYV